jgi:serine phosphatase RsbU (regulator of sigma subunit)
MWFKFVVLVLVGGCALVWYRLRIKSIKDQNLILEKQVKERTAEVVQQREELTELYTDVKDSIRAAQAIQESILPSEKLIKDYLPDMFIFNRPKDVVSGDFYFFEVKDEKFIIASVDCTGHGVSGAFMSISGHYLLKQAINSLTIPEPSEILNKLNQGIIEELNKKGSGSKILDGMDIALCIIDADKSKMQYAGANNPLYILRNKEIIQVKGDRFSIGLSVTEKINTFKNIDIPLQRGDMLYIFSDGYADQIGHNYEKFMYSKFRDLLIKIGPKDMDSQARELEEAILSWRGETEQIDDILVIGIRI